jgi:cardiolipin synthase
VTLRWLPNAICVARMLLVVPVAAALLAGAYGTTLLLFACAAVSDALDGWLAKHYGWTSELGKLLDPIADKVLLVSVFLLLAWIGLVPAWLACAAVLRDVVIVSGAIAYRLLIGPVEGRPTIASKLNTLLQLSLVLAVIARAGWPQVPRPLITALGATVFVSTVASGIDYVLTWARIAWRAGRAAHAA